MSPHPFVPSRRRRMRRTAIAATALALLGVSGTVTQAAPARSAPPPRTTTRAEIVNFERGAPRPAGFPHGAQVVKLDTDGNAIDAKADSIAYFEGSYWLHGEAFGCRYMFFPRPGFCGFRVYQSKDLVHWRSRGTILDPARSAFARETCAGATGCWGPNVVYNPRTKKYVLWFYRAIGTPIDPPLVVMTGDSPLGPWEHPTVPNVPGGFAQDVFLDEDGSAYLAWGGPGSGLNVQRLNRSYTDVVGQPTAVTRPGGSIVQPNCSPPGGFFGPDMQNQTPAALAAWKRCGITESPSIVRNGNRYFMTFSDPICAFCLGTETSYFVASSPLGPWRGRGGTPSYDPARPGVFDAYSLSEKTCGGQPFHIADLPTARGEDVHLFAAVLWTNSRNGGSANHLWEPLRFRNGLLKPLRCANVKVPLARAVPTGEAPPRAINLAGVSADGTLVQTLTAPESGRIQAVSLPLYQRTNPTRPFAEEGLVSEPLTVTLSGPRGSATRTFAPEDVSWSPTRVRLALDVRVRAGDRLRLTLSSPTPQGRYATLFEHRNPYAGGRARGTGDAAALVGPSGDLLFRAVVRTAHGRVAFGS